MAESSCFSWVRTSGPSIARLKQMSWVEAHWVRRPFLSERTSGSNWRPLEEFMFNIFQLCCCYWIIHISLISLEGTACVSIAFDHLSAPRFRIWLRLFMGIKMWLLTTGMWYQDGQVPSSSINDSSEELGFPQPLPPRAMGTPFFTEGTPIFCAYPLAHRH